MIVVVFYADRLRSAAGGSSHLLKKRESFCSSGCKHDPILCQAFFVHPVVRVRLYVGFCCSVSLFPGKLKIRETGCGKFFSREIPSRLSRQFPDFKRLRQASGLGDPLICCNPKCIILSLTQRLKFIYFFGLH